MTNDELQYYATLLFFAKNSMNQHDYQEFKNKHVKITSIDNPEGWFYNKQELTEFIEKITDY